jgi:hypothetical protein
MVPGLHDEGQGGIEPIDSPPRAGASRLCMNLEETQGEPEQANMAADSS